MSVKNSVASKAATSVQRRHDAISGIAKLLQGALGPRFCKSGLHMAEGFGCLRSVLSTLKKYFVCVGDTMMCVCKFTDATLLHMLVPRRQDRAKPRVGRVE